MRTGARNSKNDPLLRPGTQLTVCVICGMPAEWRYDKHQRPTHYCPHCGTRIFLYSVAGVAGMETLNHMISRGAARHRQSVQRIVNNRVRRHERTRVPAPLRK